MFDRFVHRMLDKIVEWCERYREYRIKRSLPKGMSAAEWAKQNQHKNADDCQ